MHLRNSWTRSTSSWEIFHSASGLRLEGRDFPIDGVIPGNVGDQIFDFGERLHGHDGDGFVFGKRVHARFAGQARAAVDFGGARAALPCFAIPADGEIGGDVSLDVVQRVEHDHAGSDGDLVVDRGAAAGVAAEYAQDCFSHR